MVPGGVGLSDPSVPPVDKHILTIFDVENRFVAYTAPIKPVRALMSEWGCLFALTREDNRLFQLTEKDIKSKLEILFKKNNYDIAVKIAKSQHYDEDGLKDIFRSGKKTFLFFLKKNNNRFGTKSPEMGFLKIDLELGTT